MEGLDPKRRRDEGREKSGKGQSLGRLLDEIRLQEAIEKADRRKREGN